MTHYNPLLKGHACLVGRLGVDENELGYISILAQNF